MSEDSGCGEAKRATKPESLEQPRFSQPSSAVNIRQGKSGSTSEGAQWEMALIPCAGSMALRECQGLTRADGIFISELIISSGL